MVESSLPECPEIVTLPLDAKVGYRVGVVPLSAPVTQEISRD